jgi:protein-S-isoprenylcysteine O-methyltransferase Ste14
MFVAFATPFIRPFRWKRLLWTYLIPLVPFMCCWDGVVSQLRAYTIGELSERTQGFEDYEWSVGSTPIHGQPRHLTFLLERRALTMFRTLHCRYTYEPDSSLSVVRRQLPRISGRTAAPCPEPGGPVHGMDVLEAPRDNRARQSMITMPRSIAVVVGLFIWLIVIPLAHGVVPWAISTRLPRYGWAGGAPGFWNLLGLIAVTLAAALLLWILALGISQTPSRVKPGLTPSFLMMHGPYRLTRNPMYVAELGLWLGWAIFFGSPAVLIGFLVLWSVVSLIILPREERSLEAAFGQTYLQYKSRVPRWFWNTNS